jgi:hypothetical protein
MSVPGTTLPREVFLSHAVKDHVFASKVAEFLRSHDLAVWYAPKELVGGQLWHDEIGKALDRCDAFMVIVSPNSVKSRWVKFELRFALNQPRLDGRIFPILYRPCEFRELSWILDSIQHVDFTKGFGRGSRDLLRIWGLDEKP